MNVKDINKLKVSLMFGNTLLEVGELVLDDSTIYFKYFNDFIEMGLSISPFKIKLNSSIQMVDNQLFDGLFGVFDDSLPDGWGRLLLDRKLLSSGINFTEINPLQRLALVGDKGHGALIYQPIIEVDESKIYAFELDEIAYETQKILAGSLSLLIDQLLEMGGSSGGARPKINIGYDPQKDELYYGNTALPQNFEHWIIKFPATYDPADISNIEYAYYLMAQDAGLNMSTSRLFKGKSGITYFGTKRFDRDKNTRLHMHSAAGMLHDNFRLCSLDYGHLMDCAFRLEKNVVAYEKILRLAAFNVFSHNRDDHSKNVAFLMDVKGNWQLAPAYDLTFSNSSHGYHSTSVAGESKNPDIEHLQKLAKNFGVKNVNNIINKVRTVVSNWDFYAENANVSQESKLRIGKVINR